MRSKKKERKVSCLSKQTKKGLMFLNMTFLLVVLILLAAFWFLQMNQGVFGVNDIKKLTNGTILQVANPALDYGAQVATAPVETQVGMVCVVIIVVIVIFSKN